MKGSDLKAFRKANNLTQDKLGEYLGIKKSFISQVESGKCPLPQEKFNKLLDNPYGWDTSMLTQEKKVGPSVISGLIPRPQNPSDERIRSALNDFLKSEEDAFVNYLVSQIEDKDILIRELYKQIGMLEAKLDLARKGEIASVVGGSSDASAV